jgi:hypothetical protein
MNIQVIVDNSSNYDIYRQLNLIGCMMYDQDDWHGARWQETGPVSHYNLHLNEPMAVKDV